MTSREDAAPIAEASRCSAYCRSSKFDWRLGSRLMRRLAAKLANELRVRSCPEIARHGVGQFLDRDGRAPQPEARRDLGEPGGHENVGLEPFDRRRRAAERKADIGEHVEAEAANDAMHQRRQIEPEQGLRAQQGDAPRSVGQDRVSDQSDLDEARQQHRVGPGDKARGHAGDRSTRGRPRPEQAAEKGGRELGDGGEGQQADRGELGEAGRAMVQIGERQNAEDR